MKKIALLAVAFAACGGLSTGRPCTSNDNCEPAQTCYGTDGGLPGGFCSKGCTQVGSIVDCPAETVCTHFAHSTAAVCAPICKVSGDCRTGYDCGEVASTDKLACQPPQS